MTDSTGYLRYNVCIKLRENNPEGSYIRVQQCKCAWSSRASSTGVRENALESAFAWRTRKMETASARKWVAQIYTVSAGTHYQ